MSTTGEMIFYSTSPSPSTFRVLTSPKGILDILIKPVYLYVPPIPWHLTKTLTTHLTDSCTSPPSPNSTTPTSP